MEKISTRTTTTKIAYLLRRCEFFYSVYLRLPSFLFLFTLEINERNEPIRSQLHLKRENKPYVWSTAADSSLGLHIFRVEHLQSRIAFQSLCSHSSIVPMWTQIEICFFFLRWTLQFNWCDAWWFSVCIVFIFNEIFYSFRM